jgi:hypothetical protein
MLRRSFLQGFAALVAAPAVVKAESLMPILVWRPTFTHHHGPYGDHLCCRKSDLIGVDLASLGLPPGRDLNMHSNEVWYWSYDRFPLASLPRDKVRIPQRRLLELELSNRSSWLAQADPAPFL